MRRRADTAVIDSWNQQGSIAAADRSSSRWSLHVSSETPFPRKPYACLDVGRRIVETDVEAVAFCKGLGGRGAPHTCLDGSRSRSSVFHEQLDARPELLARKL